MSGQNMYASAKLGRLDHYLGGRSVFTYCQILERCAGKIVRTTDSQILESEIWCN